MRKIFRAVCCGRLCAVAIAGLTCLAFAAQPAWAVIDYDRNIGADFTATYLGAVHSTIPVGNPFGDWALRGENGLVSDLKAQFGLPASSQPGWCQQHGGVCDTGGPWTYFANPWQPGVTINPLVNGHGPQDVLWTAPANLDMGAATLSGSLEQVFDPTREMRISIFKNASATPFYFIDALPPIVNGIILNRVNFSGVGMSIVPGDTLRFKIQPSSSPPPPNAGSPTFMAWNIRIQETMVPGDYNHNGTVDAGDYVVWRDGLVTIYTQSDYDLWRANFGRTAGSGAAATGDSSGSPVPEPASLRILLVAACGFLIPGPRVPAKNRC